jgi:hypothetical protein
VHIDVQEGGLAVITYIFAKEDTVSRYCWEVIGCKVKETCPAFIEKRKDCWNVPGTMCGIQFMWQILAKNLSKECISCRHKKMAEKENLPESTLDSSLIAGKKRTETP